MDAHSLIAWLIIGVIAGWAAGSLVKGGGFGLIGDITIGIFGACVGGWLSGLMGIYVGGGMILSIMVATGGAVLLLMTARMLEPKY